MEQKRQEELEEQREGLLHCRNCDGYYDPELPNCPHCGEDTANNINDSRSSSSVTQYGGGFGEAGSTLSRVAAGMIAGLLVVALVGGVATGARLLTRPGAEQASQSAPAEQSAPAQSQQGAASAAPAPEEKPKEAEKQEPAQIPPQALRLDYSDLTLVNEGESYQFQVSVDPEDWEGQLTWTTDNQSVAVISNEGKVKSVGRGECSIILSAGDVSYRCLVRCKSGADADEGGSASVQSYYINGKLMSVDEAQKVLEEERAKAAEKKRKEEEKKKAAEAKKKAEAEAKKKAEEEAKKKAEEEARKKAEEEAKKKAEEKARKKAEEEARKKAEEEEKKAEEERARIEAEEKAAQEEEKKKKNANSITLQYYDITLVNVGDSYKFEPSGGNGKSYSWSSANDDVASVTSDGLVKATGVGQTTITCTSGDASVDVIVRVRSN